MAISTNYREQYAKYSRYFRNLVETYGKKEAVRTSVELLLTLLTVSFFAVFAIRPTVDTIARLVADIKTQKDIQKTLDEKIVNLKKAQATYNAESNRLVFLDQGMPRGPFPDLLVRQLEGLAGQTGVSLSALGTGKTQLLGKNTQSDVQAKKTEPQFEVSFTVRGEYKKILSFLEDLENLRRLVNITSISVSKNLKVGEENTIILTVGAQVPYYQSDKTK